MQEILSVKAWALEKSFFERTSQMILHRLEQGRDLSGLFDGIKKNAMDQEDEEAATRKPQPISSNINLIWDDESGLRAYEMEDGRRVARISMVGTLSKYGGMCSYGSIDMINMINRANKSRYIDSISLFVDGPGGSVSGTTELGLAIRDSEKPVIAFVDEWAASAHYWVTSQASYIVGNINEYAQVGSIGVLCMLVNEGEWLTKKGLEVKIMRASKSVDKARLNSVEEWPPEQLAKLQAELDDINEDFIAAVKYGRGSRLKAGAEDIFTGQMYDLEEAISLGMVDYNGTLADAVTLAADVAKSRKRSVTN